LATQIFTFQPIKANFVYEVFRNYPKIEEFCSWNQQSRQWHKTKWYETLEMRSFFYRNGHASLHVFFMA